MSRRRDLEFQSDWVELTSRGFSAILAPVQRTATGANIMKTTISLLFGTGLLAVGAISRSTFY
jgi:hypothetical protein